MDGPSVYTRTHARTQNVARKDSKAHWYNVKASSTADRRELRGQWWSCDVNGLGYYALFKGLQARPQSQGLLAT